MSNTKKAKEAKKDPIVQNDNIKAQSLTINQRIEKLNQQIEWFYSDDFNLDQATTKYREAASSAREIEQSLDELKNQVEIIDHDFSRE